MYSKFPTSSSLSFETWSLIFQTKQSFNTEFVQMSAKVAKA